MSSFHAIDWAVVAVPLLAVLLIAWRTQRYVRGVADFMTAGRAAGRYLVCNASDQAGLGAISVVALFEMNYRSGFALGWWGALAGPISMFIALSGYVIYRYRETRVMTIAQFFEIRYSKKFRIFMGILAWLSGIINYGIFPAVSARFFVYYLGLPPAVTIGGLTVPTFALVMIAALSLGLTFTLLGGQLTVMVTDCIEGLLSGVLYVVVAVALLWMFSWTQISSALQSAPAGHSMLNPFDSGQVEDFNIWYILIGIFGSIYSCMAWQGGHAFNSSAANPHEAKMGRILGSWRSFAKGVMIMLLSICAYTYMHHPDYQVGAAEINHTLNDIPTEAIRTQMTVPVALAHFLPVGIKGIFAAIMIFAMVAIDSSYLHSWGSIFVQDVILPIRKKQLTIKEHIRYLRLSIAGVAVFAFCFSLLFQQTTYIFLFFALTGTIYLGGAGACIVGGLYWKKGTTAGAWVAAVLGGGLGIGGIVLENQWAKTVCPWLLQWWPESAFLHSHAKAFPINGQWMWLTAMLTASVTYIVISLLTCRRPFNLEKMLHRGRYAVREDQTENASQTPQTFWQKIIGIDQHFTRGDKILSLALFGWTMFWFAVFVVATVWNLIPQARWSTTTWSEYFCFTGIWLPLVIGTGTCIWFTWGGIQDLRKLFKALRQTRVDLNDDGSVPTERRIPDDQPTCCKKLAAELLQPPA